MPWLHGDWIDDDASLARPPSRWAFDPYLYQVFEQAGWKPLPPPAPKASGDAAAHARAFLDEFGGLKLCEFEAGPGWLAHEIVFANEPRPLPEWCVRRWPWLDGARVIALAARGDALLFVDGAGTLYLTEDISYRLYRLGDDFVAVMSMLVRQLAWPNAVPE